MAKQLTDEELNLRSKLRRRLIGASALILTLVVTLPMVLDSEPKATGQDIELRIPAADKVGAFVPGVETVETVVATPSSAVSAASSVAAVSTPLAQPPANVALAEPILAAPVTPKPVVAVAPVVKKDEVPAPEVKSSEAKVVETKKTEVKKSDSDVKKPDAEGKKSEAELPTPKPVLATPEKPATGFVVQVGAYANVDTAQQQFTQLKDWHFKAYTEKVGDKTRVRVGPYLTREQADQVRVLLEKHGLHPVVTNSK